MKKKKEKKGERKLSKKGKCKQTNSKNKKNKKNKFLLPQIRKYRAYLARTDPQGQIFWVHKF